MQQIKLGVITGSLRKKSFARYLGRALTSLAPSSMQCSFIEIGELQHYNEDLEVDPPQTFTRFRATIAASDAVLFVTPEFNRSMPGMLKNCLDVGSRPWGKSIWPGKPAAVISVSPGALGGFGANHALRQVLMAVGVVTMPHPEAYVGGAAALFDAAGELIDAGTKEFAGKFMLAFEAWIEQQRSRPA
jgi:chromate reductase, NAD(P)H dehydrogenase (quinone)